MCARAWQCCSLQSAFSGLHQGEAGEPLQLCRALCLCDCLVCTRFEPSSCLSPPSPILQICREFVFSPALRFGLLFPRGGPKRSWNSHRPPHPRGKQEIKHGPVSPAFLCPPPHSCPVPPCRGPGGGGAVLRRVKTGQCVAGAPRSGFGVGVTGAPGLSAALLLHSLRTVSQPSSPRFPGAEAVSLSF